MSKEDLERLFRSEDYFLEHWLIQSELDDSFGKTYKRMKKRREWVLSQLEKLKKDE